MHGSDHEIVQLFKRQQYPLSETLTEMLNEHFSHQTERRGCGFTQATRVLAEFINVARAPHELNDFKLFRDYEDQTLKNLLKERKLSDWHNLDQNIETTTLIQKNKPESTADLIKHIQFQAQLRQLAQQAQQEESKLLVQMIADIILPKSSAQTGLVELPVLAEKPKVGSCPMAENFFLKIAHGRILRKGSVNIIVNQHNQPLLLETLRHCCK